MWPVASVESRSSISARTTSRSTSGPDPAACERTSDFCSCARISVGMCRVASAPKPVEMPYAGVGAAASSSTTARALSIAASASVVSTTAAPSRATASTSSNETGPGPTLTLVVLVEVTTMAPSNSALPVTTSGPRPAAVSYPRTTAVGGALVVAGVSGLLLTLAASAAASAAPGATAVAPPATGPGGELLVRQCFMEPLRWNEALDGALTGCPAWASWAPDPEPVPLFTGERPGLPDLV